MKILFMIGWRNLWRNKRRSMVVIISISLGIFAMMVSMSLMNGMNNQMVENTISTSLGHISIQDKRFIDDASLINSFKEDNRYLDVLKKTEHVTGFSERIKIEGMIQSSETSRGVLVMGIDFQSEKSVSSIGSYMVDDNNSRYFEKNDEKSVIISKTMAKKLDLIIGDKAVLLVQDKTEEITGYALTIKGFFQSPLDSFDKFVIYVPILTAREITGIGNHISEIVIKVEERKYVDTVKASLEKFSWDSGLNILTWYEKAPDLYSSVKLFDSMMYLFFAIIFITVVFSVANTLIMAIMERFHEIGVMKSIGTKPSWIASMVIFESISLGAVGLFIGTLASVAFITFFNKNGIDFSIYMDSVRSLGTGHIIYPAFKLNDILISIIIVMSTTLIAAVYPAIKAARIKPLDALHYI